MEQVLNVATACASTGIGLLVALWLVIVVVKYITKNIDDIVIWCLVVLCSVLAWAVTTRIILHVIDSDIPRHILQAVTK